MMLCRLHPFLNLLGSLRVLERLLGLLQAILHQAPLVLIQTGRLMEGGIHLHQALITLALTKADHRAHRLAVILMILTTYLAEVDLEARPVHQEEIRLTLLHNRLVVHSLALEGK